MSEPVIEDVVVELDLNKLSDEVRIDFQVIQESLQRIQDYLNSQAQRIYDLENP